MSNHSWLFRTNFISFKTFKHPLFPKTSFLVGTFYDVFDSKTALLLSFFQQFNSNSINFDTIKFMTHFSLMQGIPTKQVWIWWSLPILGCWKSKVHHTFDRWYGALKHFLPWLPKQQIAHPAQNWRLGQGACQKIQDHGSWNLEGMR